MRRAGIVAISLVAALCAVVVLVSGLLMAAQQWRESRDVGPPAGALFATAGDVAIHYVSFGPSDGPPLIIVPGTAAWSGFWRAAAERIGAAGFHVLAIDLPPFGFSERPASGAYGRADQAERLAAFIAALKLERPIVLAHSFGAGAAVELALRKPDLPGRLVLVDAALGLPPEGQSYPPDAAISRFAMGRPWLARALVDVVMTNPLLTRTLLAKLLHKTDAATEEQATILREPYGRRGTSAAYAQWLPSLLFPDRSALSADPGNYASLKAPVALIWGSEDAVTPLGQARRLMTIAPNATLDVIEGAGHIPHIEDEASFVAAVTSRLR